MQNKKDKNPNWEYEKKRLTDILKKKGLKPCQETNTAAEQAFKEDLDCFNKAFNTRQRELTEDWAQSRNCTRSNNRDCMYRQGQVPTPNQNIASVPEECCSQCPKRRFTGTTRNNVEIMKKPKPNTLKNQAWKEVLTSFNVLNKRERELNEMRTQWQNNQMGCLSPQIHGYRQAGNSTGEGSSASNVMAKFNQRDMEIVNSCQPGMPIHLNAMDNYEKQIFELTKKAKLREFERAEELHKKRIAIMSLEQEYWKIKIIKDL